ncbi:twin-arginine translocation signal domain-containing protein [Polyangium fumosum]|uniref:Twin-arginine translocation signal domain-containing protein n=1 Tax=Polyangium fumosum TaxID=889272 RepID=A0A4U1J9I1_9BACT|nr:twin-arginine translocation signal domain-containing protein [Polyangium fumosum]
MRIEGHGLVRRRLRAPSAPQHHAARGSRRGDTSRRGARCPCPHPSAGPRSRRGFLKLSAATNATAGPPLQLDFGSIVGEAFPRLASGRALNSRVTAFESRTTEPGRIGASWSGATIRPSTSVGWRETGRSTYPSGLRRSSK